MQDGKQEYKQNTLCLKEIDPGTQELEPAKYCTLLVLPANPEKDVDWSHCELWFHLNMLREVQMGT